MRVKPHGAASVSPKDSMNFRGIFAVTARSRLPQVPPNLPRHAVGIARDAVCGCGRAASAGLTEVTRLPCRVYTLDGLNDDGVRICGQCACGRWFSGVWNYFSDRKIAAHCDTFTDVALSIPADRVPEEAYFFINPKVAVEMRALKHCLRVIIFAAGSYSSPGLQITAGGRRDCLHRSCVYRFCFVF